MRNVGDPNALKDLFELVSDSAAPIQLKCISTVISDSSNTQVFAVGISHRPFFHFYAQLETDSFSVLFSAPSTLEVGFGSVIKANDYPINT